MRTLHIRALVVVRPTSHHSDELLLSASELGEVHCLVEMAYSVIGKHEGVEVIDHC